SPPPWAWPTGRGCSTRPPRGRPAGGRLGSAAARRAARGGRTVDARRLTLEDRLARAAHGAPAFATLSADQRRAVVRAYLARRQAGCTRRELERLLDHNPDHFRDVFALHRRQSTFEEDVAAWPLERER